MRLRRGQVGQVGQVCPATLRRPTDSDERREETTQVDQVRHPHQEAQEAPVYRGHPEERRGATDSPLGPNNGIVADR
jgi:hypothetical protein